MDEVSALSASKLCKAPELVGEVLAALGSGLLPAEECEHLLASLAATCPAKELYIFLLEALCSGELNSAGRVRGVAMLRDALLAMQEAKRHLFLSSCLPVLLKRCAPTRPTESTSQLLEALRTFAVTFTPVSCGSSRDGPAAVVQASVSAFLFKLLQSTLPCVLQVESIALDGQQASELPGDIDRPATRKEVPGLPSPGAGERKVILRPSVNVPAEALQGLCRVAMDATASTTGLLALLEGMDVGDPTGDGGGDLEVSSLCLSALVCLLEEPGCCSMGPQVLPLVLSPARRLNVLMRSCFVLLSNRDEPSSVSLADPCPMSSGPFAPRWPLRGLDLFARAAGPVLQEAALQTPRAFASLSGPLCRWYPERTFQALLEALASTENLERDARGALFYRIRDAMRRFDWPCRFALYRHIIDKCRVDSIIGAVVSMFKDDWWLRVQAAAEDHRSLAEERTRVVEILKATLSGDVQVVDGMDTLTAALNVARLVALAGGPVGAFLRSGLVAAGVDLNVMLAGVSQQIDFELTLLDTPGCDGGLAGELIAKAMGEALGTGGVDLKAMKRDRISMVAHLVARVREVVAVAEA